MRQREQLYVLPDGTRITVKQGERGKPLCIYEGQFWQRPLYNLFGTNISGELRGYENSYSLFDSNATAVVFRRSHAQSLATPWNGNIELMAVRRDGVHTPGSQHLVNFLTKSTKGLTRVTAEEIYWEFTDLEANATGFQLYYTNQPSESSVLEFSFPIKNRN